MHKIKLMNKISSRGIECFNQHYIVGEEVEEEDAILVRSASLHDYSFPTNLKAIARAGAGVNNIPIEACSEKGIVVFNTPGANANAVKELVLCSLFLASRKVVEGIAWVNSQSGNEDEDIASLAEKQKANYVGPEIDGKTLGIIGLGAIGVAVANAATKLGMNVLGYDPFLSVNAAWGMSKWVKNAESLDVIFKESDYISIHVPSTKETKGFINADSFKKMKDGVRILNFARGDLIDNTALLAALDSHKVERYISDFIVNELIGKENVIFMPHLGASTPESEDNCAKMATEQIIDYLENGNINHSVNFPRVVQARESKTRICLTNKNVPNILARISKLFADHHVNIENMVNRSKADYAYTLIDTNEEIRQDIIDRIKSIEGVISVRVLK